MTLRGIRTIVGVHRRDVTEASEGPEEGEKIGDQHSWEGYPEKLRQ